MLSGRVRVRSKTNRLRSGWEIHDAKNKRENHFMASRSVVVGRCISVEWFSGGPAQARIHDRRVDGSSVPNDL